MSNSQETQSKDHGKQATIIVNGRPKVVTEKEMAFLDIVLLAFDRSSMGENIIFTVTYRKGDDKKPEGTLVEGKTVKIKDGMIFNVIRTDKS